MIVTFTDFGIEGPYLGQMRGVLYQSAPGVPVIDLMVDVPTFDIRAAAYLLPRVMEPFGDGTICLAVVDPGVGSFRRPIVLESDGCWFVGPDNGLFEMIARRAKRLNRWWEVTYAPDRVSASFHGRDIFAPVAAMIACKDTIVDSAWGRPIKYEDRQGATWPDDWAHVVYIDRYGNCMTGLRWDNLDQNTPVKVNGIEVPIRRTFSDCAVGEVLCYQNSLGLLEFAVNQGNAAEYLGLKQGSQVSVRMLSDK